MEEACEQKLQDCPGPNSSGEAFPPAPPPQGPPKAEGQEPLMWRPPAPGCPPSCSPSPNPPCCSSATEGTTELLQEVSAGRCVVIEITNNLHRVTLRNPRSYCFSGHSQHPPAVEIAPGSVGRCSFVKGSYSLRGSVGVLVYEGDTFSLAIMFSNPFDYNLYYIEFGLKLLPKKHHIQSMEDLFREMMESCPPQGLSTFQKTKLSHSQSPVRVTMDNVLVTATMSNAAKAVLTILLQEKPHKEL